MPSVSRSPLSATPVTITSGPDLYLPGSTCKWVVFVTGPNDNSITISFSQLQLGQYDYIFVSWGEVSSLRTRTWMQTVDRFSWNSPLPPVFTVHARAVTFWLVAGGEGLKQG